MDALHQELSKALQRFFQGVKTKISDQSAAIGMETAHCIKGNSNRMHFK
jgi:hypothetical protein